MTWVALPSWLIDFIASQEVVWDRDLRMDLEHATDACICGSARSSFTTQPQIDSAIVDQLWNVTLRYFLHIARNVARSSVAAIPGASSFVDSTFDSLDKAVADHANEALEIVQRAYNDIVKILDESRSGIGNLEGVGPGVEVRVLNVLRKRTAELFELSKKAGGNTVDEVLEKNPRARKNLGGGYEQLKTFVEGRGAEVKKALDEASNRVRGFLDLFPFHPEDV